MTGKRRSPSLLLPLIVLGSLIASAGAVFIGSESISPGEVLILDDIQSQIFWQIRVPRVLGGFLAGAALAVSGMIFQAVFRNSLATPFTLGVSSGACFGAAVALKAGLIFVFMGISSIAISAFIGALVTVGIIYFLTSLRHDFSTEAMLLAGVAMSFFFSAAILVVQYISDFTGSFQLVRWMMGNLSTVGYQQPVQLAVLLAPVLIVVAWLARDLNWMLAGDEMAMGKGVPVRRTRSILFVVVSLLTGAVVAAFGPIGFVGMMIPHTLRLVLGVDHRRLLWASMFAGGGFLVICDTLARTLIAPAEIPVGIVTALLGGPFFLWLLVGKRSRRFFF